MSLGNSFVVLKERHLSFLNPETFRAVSELARSNFHKKKINVQQQKKFRENSFIIYNTRKFSADNFSKLRESLAIAIGLCVAP